MSIRAGGSAKDITPKDSVQLTGFPGARRMSNGVRDKLYASALHLRGGSGGIIIVSLDLYNLDPSTAEMIRNRITEATGTREENILVGTSHTHSGPAGDHAIYQFGRESFSRPNPEYLLHVIDQAVQAASEAAVASIPAGIATISLTKEHTGAMLIRDNRTSRIIAVLMVHDEIPDLLGPDNCEISSDFVGDLRKVLTKRFGGEPAVLYFAGPSADRRLLRPETMPGPDSCVRRGKELASAIVKKVKTLAADDFLTQVDFAGTLIRMPNIPRRNLPNEHEAAIAQQSVADVAAMLKNGEIPEERRLAAAWAVEESDATMNLLMSRGSGLLANVLSDYDPAVFQLIQIGDMRILTMPTSIFPDAGAAIVKAAGKDIWLAECVNGDMESSFLALIDGEKKEYRLMSTLFAPQTGNMLVNSALSLIK